LVSGQSSYFQALEGWCGALAIIACLACTGHPSPAIHDAPPRPGLPYNRVLFAGDVMFSRAVRREILAAKDPALPFRKVAPLTSGADIAFINLETPFSDQGPYREDGLIFHAAPEMIAALQVGGVTVASTANNHSRDCAAHGVEYTVKWLRSHGISAVGSSESASETHRGVVVQSKGIRFGFLAYTYDQKNGNWKDIDERIAVADPDVMVRDVRSLRDRADVVIISMHHGIEYMPKPSKDQIAFAHAAIDAGADLVIGHHPHVIQAAETYRGRPIFYSLGNFVFDQYQREATQHGEMVEVSFLGPKVLSTYVMPVKITRTGPELE
jgi:poly-gamma-glutamate capsule biosynthesis protein CapA/YwtB (metallophosphatase superfamily)